MRSFCLSGDVYLQEEEEMVRMFVTERLKQRGYFNGDEFPIMGEELLAAMLPPGAAQRLDQYMKLKPDLEDLGGGFLCDVEQWPKAGRSEAGPFFPCQLTHGTICDLKFKRVALGSDHLVANGWHLHRKLSSEYYFPCADFFRKRLSNEEQKMVAGNGQSLPAIAAWYMYVFCNVARRSCVLPASPSVRPEIVGDDLEESDRGGASVLAHVGDDLEESDRGGGSVLAHAEDRL